MFFTLHLCALICLVQDSIIHGAEVDACMRADVSRYRDGRKHLDELLVNDGVKFREACLSSRGDHVFLPLLA